MVDPLRLGVGVVILVVGLASVFRPDTVEATTDAAGVARGFAALSAGQQRAVGLLLVLVGAIFLLGGLTF